ncbi:MAG: RNA-guided endonuclease InsQ/TnpB family protein [Trueperaceae bacterium]
MKLTAKIKLTPTPEQRKLLRQTLETANAACNYISDIAWEKQVFKQFPLHRLVYFATKEKFDLGAQMVVRLEAKVSDSYKLDKKTKRTFKKHGAIAYDSRIFTYKPTKQEVSIWLMGGRQTISFQAGQKQLELLTKQAGESDLVLIKGEFYLLATCDIPEPTPDDVEGYLGVDLGINQIASDSDGESHSGSHVKSVRYRNKRLRAKLQKKGTKSATRKLKKRSGREARFSSNTNHVVAKRIVDKAKRTNRAIALENLKGIRARIRARKPQRSTLHSWAFNELTQFIEYKATLAGIPVVYVDPRNTSKECNQCGHIDKANRPSQAVFKCQACGHAAHADINASRNIARRAVVKLPNVCKVESKSVHVSFDGQATRL